MNSILDNSIWPNLNGELGSITTPIPDGVTVKWPDGDALVGNFVYKDGKLVGFVDSKALIPNDTKSSNLPYDCVHTSFERILDGDFTFDGTRKNHFEIKCSDLVNFAKINLSEILSDVKFVVDLDESSENKLVVHTDRVDDSKLEEISTILSNVLPANIEVMQYNHNMEISWRDINKYAECIGVEAMKAVNPDYKNDLTSDGEWVYPLPKMGYYNFNSGRDTADRLFENAKNLKKLGIKEFPVLRSAQWMFNNTDIEEIDCSFPNIQFGNYLFTNSKTRVIRTEMGRGAADASDRFNGCTALEEIYCDMSWESHFVRTFAGCKKLRVLDSDFSNANNLSYAFSGCQLPKSIVLRVCNTIPDKHDGSRHNLTLGIHVDLQNDPEVLTAISNAEAKGWTLTIQWSGTPTSTANTMTMGSLIYAKVGEMETSDGTTERVLDWGHYVTNEEGYETFRSLESAYEHFGLEMPSIGD